MSATRRTTHASMLGAAIAVSACTSPQAPPSTLAAGDPPELRADYAIFEHRCSKCHALSRAFDSGIDNDLEWEHYVARMRRQPGSGITEKDGVAVLRYLHVLVQRQRKAKEPVDAPR